MQAETKIILHRHLCGGVNIGNGLKYDAISERWAVLPWSSSAFVDIYGVKASLVDEMPICQSNTYPSSDAALKHFDCAFQERALGTGAGVAKAEPKEDKAEEKAEPKEEKKDVVAHRYWGVQAVRVHSLVTLRKGLNEEAKAFFKKEGWPRFTALYGSYYVQEIIAGSTFALIAGVNEGACSLSVSGVDKPYPDVEEALEFARQVSTGARRAHDGLYAPLWVRIARYDDLPEFKGLLLSSHLI